MVTFFFPVYLTAASPLRPFVLIEKVENDVRERLSTRPAVATLTATDALLDETARLVAIPSVSGDEGLIADYVAECLRGLSHLSVRRIGHTVVATWEPYGGSRHRARSGPHLLLAGHLDTVAPVDPPQAVGRHGDHVTGRGTVDMKGGVAVLLDLARHTLPTARVGGTIVLTDREELGSHRSGMRMLATSYPHMLAADAAIVMEPTGGWVEMGCQGSMRVRATYSGKAAHTARPWRGVNAIRRAAPDLSRCLDETVSEVVLAGFTYPQALEVVSVSAGFGGNTLPDRCEIEVNARYAPSRSAGDVLRQIHGLFPDADEFQVVLDSPAAPPACDIPLLAPLRKERQRPKLGWTDVGLLAQLGIPAVNFGPGDPELAHGPAEYVSAAQLGYVRDRLAAVIG